MPTPASPAATQPPPPDTPFADGDYVVGGDLSLTSCGVSALGHLTLSKVLGQVGITKLTLANRMRAVQTLGHLTIATACPGAHQPRLVLLEAPDTSRAFGGLVERIALTYEVTMRCLQREIPVGWVPSPILKGYATGKGGGKDSKKAVLAAAQRLWPDLHIRKTDQADSIFLAAMALDVLGGGRLVSDAQAADWLHRGAIEWPTEVA